MKAFAHSSKRRQRGVAALFVSVVLLVAVTLMVMFASRVALLDQRTSANEYRHSQAFVIAEAGLEQAAAFLRAEPRLHDPGEPDGWVACESGDPFPCDDDDPTVQWVFGAIDSGVFTSSVDPLLDPVTLEDPAMPQATSFLVRTGAGRVRGIGVGTSDDGTGAAVVQVDFGIATILSPGELPPLMAPEADLSGNFTIVPNPNLGGPGVAISAWTTNPTTGSGVGSWQTCDHGEFRDGGNVCLDTKSGGGERDWGGCSCSDTRSTPTDIRSDIVIYDETEFPESPFTYVFGDPETDTLDGLRPELKAMAETLGLVLPNCNNLETAFNGLVGSALVWIEGECNIPQNTTIGTREKPIILVVEGDTRINANTELWGLVVGLGASMALNGGPVIHGAIVSEVATDLTNGNYKQVYDEGVFTNLRDDSINTALVKLDYSWRDFRP